MGSEMCIRDSARTKKRTKANKKTQTHTSKHTRNINKKREFKKKKRAKKTRNKRTHKKNDKKNNKTHTNKQNENKYYRNSFFLFFSKRSRRTATSEAVTVGQRTNAWQYVAGLKPPPINEKSPKKQETRVQTNKCNNINTLSPPCLILRDQAGSTCSRAR